MRISQYVWTPERIKTLIAMSLEGFDHAVIRERLCVSQASLYHKIGELRQEGKLPPKNKTAALT